MCYKALLVYLTLGLLILFPFTSPSEDNFYTPLPLTFLEFSQTERGGIGYDSGYTTLGALTFLPYFSENLWPYLDFRAHHLDNNEYAVNFGLGMRWNFGHVLGWNFFYDYRSDHRHRLQFNQIGMGFEFFGPCYDLRLNGYFPFDNKKLVEHCFFKYPGGYFMSLDQFKVAMPGVDVEVGTWFCCRKFYAAAGSYYFGGPVCRDALGGKARLYASICQYLSFEGRISYDDLFKTRIQGRITISIPFGCICEGIRCLATQPIRREEIIVLSEKCDWDWNF